MTKQDIQAVIDGVLESSQLEGSNWDEELARLYKMKVDLAKNTLSKEDEEWFNHMFK